MFNFDAPLLLYWARFLNVILVALLVRLAYDAARLIFPENQFVRLGVPSLLAFMPETTFYSIQSDVLSPLVFGMAFICLIKFLRAENPGVLLGVATGLAMAATFLTKSSNWPLLLVSGALVCFKAWQLGRAGKLRAALAPIAVIVLCAGVPALAWLVWCKTHFGDFTGSAAKISLMGWTHKPLSEWWGHPIFTPRGGWTFFSALIATFWQGEMFWGLKPVALPFVNLFYVFSSICFIGVTLMSLSKRNSTVTALQHQALWFGFSIWVSLVLFLGFISILFDFHDCPYPSRNHPYFTSGRLMLGALIPFLLLYVYDLDRLLSRVKGSPRPSNRDCGNDSLHADYGNSDQLAGFPERL